MTSLILVNYSLKKIKIMLEVNLIPTLKKLFDIQFIKKSFYNFLPTDKPYSDFLAINYDNDFFTLSNGNVFVILLLQTDKKIVEKIKEKLNFIFKKNRFLFVCINFKTLKSLLVSKET